MNISDPRSSSWPFGHLRMFGYGAILADPPWAYVMRSDKGYTKSPECHYSTMSHEELCSLPVGQLASGDCLLVMWSTWPHLEQAMAVMAAWGFTFKTGGAWIKRTTTGKAAFGTGYLLRSASEPFLVGTIGNPSITSRSERNVIEPADPEAFPPLIDAERREHSRKPAEMRAMIERLLPNAFACELFAREPWPGHDVWGNETEKFSNPEAA